jgi:hypothetical protein
MENLQANKTILSKKEAREFIGIGEDLFDNLLKKGKIKGKKIGKCKTIFFKDELEAQLKKL